MSLRTQRDAEIEKQPEYKGELSKAIAATDYTSEVEAIKALIKSLRKKPREK